MRVIKNDMIARMPLARLSVSDVERWHTRLRQNGMRDAGVKNQHGVLRAALSLAVRWGWATNNVASTARLRSTKAARRTVMTLDDVRAVMVAAATIDPAAALMLRVAAVSGARRAELAALQWSDLQHEMLTVDSAIEALRRERELSSPWMFGLGPVSGGYACPAPRSSSRRDRPRRDELGRLGRRYVRPRSS